MKWYLLLKKMTILMTSIALFLTSLELLLFKNGYFKKSIFFDWIADVNYYIPDKELIYRIKNNYYSEKYNLYTNQLGLKTDSAQAITSMNTIIVLGDSFVWGNTTYSDTYPAQLERLLKQSGKSIQVLNAGISGYGTDQEYLLFTKRILPNVRPSALIWNININDIFDNIDRPVLDIKVNRLVQIPAWKHGFYLNAVFRNNIPSYLKQNSNLVNFISYKLSNIRFYRINSMNLTKWSVDKMRIEFNEMAKLSQKYSFKLIFVISPSQNIVEDLPNKKDDLEAIQLIRDAIGTLNFLDQNEYFLEHLKNNTYSTNNIDQMDRNILGISTAKNGLFLDEKEKFPKGLYHPNTSGNFLMAASVYNQMSKHK